MSEAPVVMLHTDAGETAREIVAAAHPDLLLHLCESYDALPEMLARTEPEVVYSVRFAGTPHFPRQSLIDAASLKWIAVGGSGTDHLAPWDPARLAVTNSAGVAAGMMAEYALGAMLAFSLDFRGFERAQAEERWTAGRVAPIEGRTVLIVGFGHTGAAVARRAKAMGMRVLGVRARPQPSCDADEMHAVADLPDLWPRADVIVIAVPLLPSTRGLVDAAAFGAMRPDAVLIDVSRGGVVAEAALVAALAQGRIKGAALDVFATEPLPKGHPLWRMGNVIVTPHCSSVYDGWDRRSVARFAENLSRYRAGDELFNIVDPARGY
ncbi:MAG TPA: D-2-hydroxyacid dehydrogenase [Lichenihabitans sp.]|jgi:phosphoglycerate dehydrogenase-like enzyme|nr:D-2-hydroxyacid dehydrogenase [Lichenihabitans sp.]